MKETLAAAADLNALKNYMIAGKHFVAKTTWDAYDPLTKIRTLSNFLNMMQYRSETDVVASYQKTNEALGNLWADFARYAESKGNKYDYAGAFKQIVPDNLNQQVSSARTLFASLVKKELGFWEDNPALVYSPTVIDDAVKLYKDWGAHADTLVSLPVADMTASSRPSL